MIIVAVTGAVILFLALGYHILLFLKAGIYPSRYVLQRRIALLASGLFILMLIIFFSRI